MLTMPLLMTVEGEIEIQKIGKYYKYYIGKTSTYDEAKKLQEKCKEAFPDSFIVAFQGTNPLSLQNANESKQKNKHFSLYCKLFFNLQTY
jgi:radical SAM superfamily enzyme